MRAKIIVVGPPKAGKSVLTNFFTESADLIPQDYHPTKGCRIVESEEKVVYENRRNIDLEVELWDCSGDRTFESCWDAFGRDVHGMVMVYDTNIELQERDLDLYYGRFGYNHLEEEQCLVIGNTKGTSSNSNTSEKFSQHISALPMCFGDIENDPDSIKAEYVNFLSNVARVMADKMDQEEDDLMKA